VIPLEMGLKGKAFWGKVLKKIGVRKLKRRKKKGQDRKGGGVNFYPTDTEKRHKQEKGAFTDP